MTTSNRRRVALVGIDGFSPSYIERYLATGKMPALEAIRASGAAISLISTLPACTPVAWASMSTGCHPVRSGIQGFLMPRPGHSLDDRIAGVYAHQLQAEPIWKTALLNGKRAYVVKFPVSYPSNELTFRVDGAAGWGGISCLHEVASASVSTWPNGFTLTAAWSRRPPEELGNLSYARLELPNLWGNAPIVCEIALGTRSGEPVVVLAAEPHWDSAQQILAVTEFSLPLILSAEGRRGREEHAVRFKVLALSLDPLELRLFNTSVHALVGHSVSDPDWRYHLAAVGPIEEQTDPELLFAGKIDIATHIERCRLNLDWLCRISRSILKREPWDLYMVQLHFVDWAHHILQGAIDPRHPLHDPSKAKAAEALLGRFYGMADELVAAVAEAAGPEADLVVLGDHGQDLHHTTLRLNEWLGAEGLLFWAEDGRTIDHERTRVSAIGNGLYLNRADRVPGGRVSPDDVPRFIEALSQRLLALTDPRTGICPILVAGPREHFASLGGDGDSMGDIVFCLASGYQARNDRGPLFQITMPGREFTSGHDHFWPLDPRLYTRLYAAGPSIAKIGQLPGARPIIDVAPTLAAILEIPPAPETQGQPIGELLTVEACDRWTPFLGETAA